MVANKEPDNVIAFSGNTMVYESVKRFALKGINDLIRVLMENIDDTLFELSEKVETDRERNMYFDAMREIRLKRQQIQENFDVEMQECFDRLLLNRSARTAKADDNELSLVAQEEVEDQLAIDNMISKARPHFEDDLYAVLERLQVVLHRKTIEEDLNPLDPKAICESFHQASECLESDIHVRLIFYKMFDKFVVSNLGGFYRELNDFFIQKGVLPDFQASAERLKHNTRFMANRIRRPENRDNQPASPLDLAPSDDPTLTGNQAPVDGNVLSILQQALGPAAAAYITGETPVFTGQVGDGSSNQNAFSTAGGSAVINPDYVAALSGLQLVSRNNQPVQSINPVQYKNELQQQLVDFKQQNSHLSSSNDNQIIDIVSMLFDFFFDDEALPDPIKVLIGRLQIPILKVAMIDDSFFNQKKHPARKLLDSISKASMGWSSDQQEEQVLIDKIEHIVDYLLAEFEEDISVFETALEKFKAFLNEENEKVKDKLKQVEHQEQEQEERIEHAQRLASSFIQKMLNKDEFSFAVIEFLEGIWLKVLTTTLAMQSDDSKHWKNLKRITTTMVWTLIPKHSEEDRVKLLKTLPSLLRALSRGMELINIDSEAQNQVFKMLVLQHAKVVKQTSKNLVTRVDDKTIWPESGVQEAFAGYAAQKEDPDEAVDIQFSQDDTGEIKVVENELDETHDIESLTNVAATPTRDVLQNLDEFTECVNQGKITIDEEIILDSAPPEFVHQPEDEQDASDELARSIAIGDWIEFNEPGDKVVNAKLSWKSNVTGKYIFVNRHGVKIKNITLGGLAMEFRSRRAKKIESVSVFDRAIKSFMSTLKH